MAEILHKNIPDLTAWRYNSHGFCLDPECLEVRRTMSFAECFIALFFDNRLLQSHAMELRIPFYPGNQTAKPGLVYLSDPTGGAVQGFVR